MTFTGALALRALRAYSHVAPTGRGAYRLARLARRLVPRAQWCGDFTLPDRTRLTLDLATYPDCCMAVGLYELDTLRLLHRLLRPGDYFVDCGANIGYFTLAAARRVGATGRVDAVEPDPLNRARLEAHVKANGVANVHMHPVALSDATGHATLYHPTGDRNHGEASLYAPPDARADAYEVDLGRLDQVVDRVPDLIKMDVEGAELAALRGATEFLRAPRPPAWIIEHNPESARAAGHRPGDLLRLLRDFRPDYRAQWVGRRLEKLRTSAEIDAIAAQGNILYAVP